jgi:hypothetical protein
MTYYYTWAKFAESAYRISFFRDLKLGWDGLMQDWAFLIV